MTPLLLPVDINAFVTFGGVVEVRDPNEIDHRSRVNQRLLPQVRMM